MSKVFLVEDDETMLSLLKTLLALEGFQVDSSNGKEQTNLLEDLRRANPEISVIDVHLRNESGIEILRKIRQDPQLKGMRVLMTSGMDVSSQCLAAGADGFLLKPYMPEDLIQSIRSRGD
jgi:CheY-like chemotaxis protein